MATDNPAVARIKLGTRLKQMRLAAGMTVEAAARELLVSTSVISRSETAERPASARTVRDLCLLYGAGEATTAELTAAAQTIRRATYGHDPWLISGGRGAMYLSLEQDAATAITAYAMDAVPALLRTAGYADQLPGRPARELQEARQRVLGAVACDFTLDEAILHRAIGGPGVMAGQLARITGLMENGTAVRVVPFGAGMAPLTAAGNFTILEFGGEIPAMAFAEANGGYADRSGDLELYRETILVAGEHALSAADSLALIERMWKSHNRQ